MIRTPQKNSKPKLERSLNNSSRPIMRRIQIAIKYNYLTCLSKKSTPIVFLQSLVKMPLQYRCIILLFPTAPLPTTTTLIAVSTSSSRILKQNIFRKSNTTARLPGDSLATQWYKCLKFKMCTAINSPISVCNYFEFHKN